MYEHTVIISKAFKFQLKFQNIFIYDWKPYQKISHVFIITYIFFLCMGAPWKSPVSEWAKPQGNTMKGSSGPLFLQQEGNGAFYDKRQSARQAAIHLVILELFFLGFSAHFSCAAVHQFI